MTVNAKKIAAGLGSDTIPEVHSHLCRTEAGKYAEALREGEPLLIACTQEAPLFQELAGEAESTTALNFTNIRERAGWCAGKADVSAKMAALLAEAALDVTPAGSISLKSQGICLVYGAGEAALDAARKLSARLSVTLLLTDATDIIPPAIVDVPIYSGKVVAASGGFGNFEVIVDNYAPTIPSSKDAVQFTMARDGAASECDLIFDMSGGTPLFPSHERRDGYFHVDPSHPAGVMEAMFEISDLVGEFEKPLYVTYNPDICAHSRSRKTGCTRCLDVCPASAITSEGDIVSIDPVLCGGCGACASVCPTGATSYAYPGREDLIRRAQMLVSTFLGAGGREPVVLVHDGVHGNGIISMMSRYGKGLPANVIPFAVNETTSVSHDFLSSALASGAERIVLLCDPKKQDELEGLQAQCELVNSIMGSLGYGEAPRTVVLVEADPDKVEAELHGLKTATQLKPHSFTAIGDKRTIARSALTLLNETAPKPQEVIDLPDGAPYGRITVNTEGCTLCLACVSACPVNAIQDNSDKPQITFVEQACVQCGLCRNTCPESVITLEPRFDFTNQAMSPIVLNEEEPFECITCGKPFGTRSSVERISAQLAGKHSMFADEERSQVIKMCDDCRINHLTTLTNNPLAGDDRPRVRTTMDYLEAREARGKGGKNGELSVHDFLLDDD